MQERDFHVMSCELKNAGGCVGTGGAMQMFLKYSPDALGKLFDRCLIKPIMGQVRYMRETY
jgi:hypothetical protein